MGQLRNIWYLRLGVGWDLGLVEAWDFWKSREFDLGKFGILGMLGNSGLGNTGTSSKVVSCSLKTP